MKSFAFLPKPLPIHHSPVIHVFPSKATGGFAAAHADGGDGLDVGASGGGCGLDAVEFFTGIDAADGRKLEAPVPRSDLKPFKQKVTLSLDNYYFVHYND